MEDKQSIRERVWQSIESAPEVRRLPGTHGRIPNFVGAEAAAERLAALPEWRAARVIKLNPDSPQLPVRARAIDEGKLVYMAYPKLASETPFFVLERSRLGPGVSALDAASIAGANRHGIATRLEDMSPIDLIVSGTVAVNARGVRIGKGGGYADLELALLSELGLVGENTLLVTSVHDLQVLDQELPETAHDFRVDRIVTPTRVLECPRVARPRGILWQDLDAAKIASIPLLARRLPR
ncbi:MAG: 5-formyltetrahydrofolate cyclo-ligase [Polyangiaceae bacterium]